MLPKVEHFEQEWFQFWLDEMHEEKRYHRKVWEYVMVLKTLYDAGMIQEGKRGIGFAVGTEPLPSVFAKYGIEVVVTDQPDSKEAQKLWGNNNMLSQSKEDLYRKDVVDKDAFDKLVTFNAIDMRSSQDLLLLKQHYGTFDFVWSCCSFEHIGGLENGKYFVAKSADLLKPGGIAVHTTEYNYTSNDRTLESPSLSLYRKKDIEDLIHRMGLMGYTADPVSYERGDHEYDLYTDKPPYTDAHKNLCSPSKPAHLFLNIGGFDATSILLVFKKMKEV